MKLRTIILVCITLLFASGNIYAQKRKGGRPARVPCVYRHPLPNSCKINCGSYTCQIDIANAHEIYQSTFTTAIAGFYHRPCSKIKVSDVLAMIAGKDCKKDRVQLTGDFGDPTTNEDIRFATVPRTKGYVYYELATLRGIIDLGADEMWFYKGHTTKGGMTCNDILIEVKRGTEYFYYDLSDSEDNLHAYAE